VHEIANQITNNQYAFAYAVIWGLGALATLAVSTRDSSYHDVGRMLGASGCGGFLALCAIGLLGSRYPSSFFVGDTDCPSLGILSVAVASGAGLLGKHSDLLLRSAVDWVTKGQVKLPVDEPEPKQPK